MKQSILLLLLLMLTQAILAQTDTEDENHTTSDINIKFYHIDANVDLDNPILKGNVLIDFLAVKDNLQKFTLDLHQDYKVDKVEGASSFVHKDNKLVVTLQAALPKNELGTIRIFYAGTAPKIKSKNGLEKGLIYSTHGKKDNVVIATACFPNNAALWFPCKESAYDKADSLYVDITIVDKKVEEIYLNPNTQKEVSSPVPVIAVSNGVLKKIRKNEDGTRTFQWRHGHRIAPHHVLIAISDFMKVEKEFEGRGYKYPIDFYIFPEKFKSANAMFNRAPEIMTCLTNTFGEYPYKDEGLSITMVGIPLGDGMPTQTNVILEDMKSTHMYMLVHQAASMWFGNHISPATWQDAWLTEALAGYAEAMWQEYKRGLNVYQIILDEKEYFEGGKLYIDNPADYSEERFNKKGMYVIHMLRGIMEDAYFFESLKAITAKKRIRGKEANTYLSSQRLKEVCEYYASENYDVDYGYFFDQWVKGEYYPSFMVKYQVSRGKLTINLKQKEQETSPSLFRMPIRLELVDNEGNVIKEKIESESNKVEKIVEIDVSSNFKEMRFDPANWVFKDLEYVCEVTNENFELEDFQIETTNHRRKVAVKFNIAKKQDIVIDLVEVADGTMLLEDKILSTQEFKKEQGAFEQSFKIPLSYTQRGAFKLIVRGKGETYSKILRLKRIKDDF